jgi:hypothetical protein
MPITSPEFPPSPSGSLYHRVLHTATKPGELRVLLNREWATISVVSGLFVLLEGQLAGINVFSVPPNNHLDPAVAVIRYLFLAFNIISYSAAVTSCAGAEVQT